MRAINLESCSLIMVEQPVLPRVRVMTCFAVSAEACFVYIVDVMACITFVIGRVVDRCQVAFFALDGSVHAYQREPGQVVIEKDLVVPAFFVMAVVALLALLAAMNVVFFMALDAIGFHFVFFNLALVAV